MRKTMIIAAAVSIASLGLAGCDVEKTQEGNVTLPNYEVSKTQEGDVTLPKYDVDAPDVNVTTTEKEVTVPKVVTEQETIEVPKVEISRADDDDNRERTEQR